MWKTPGFGNLTGRPGELTDYLTNVGINLEALGLSTVNKKIRGFTKSTPGWGGELPAFLENFLDRTTLENLAEETKPPGTRERKQFGLPKTRFSKY